MRKDIWEPENQTSLTQIWQADVTSTCLELAEFSFHLVAAAGRIHYALQHSSSPVPRVPLERLSVHPPGGMVERNQELNKGFVEE